MRKCSARQGDGNGECMLGNGDGVNGHGDVVYDVMVVKCMT